MSSDSWWSYWALRLDLYTKRDLVRPLNYINPWSLTYISVAIQRVTSGAEPIAGIKSTAAVE